jgi:hypothetical protein
MVIEPGLTAGQTKFGLQAGLKQEKIAQQWAVFSFTVFFKCRGALRGLES